jgi:hypothetical protein
MSRVLTARLDKASLSGQVGFQIVRFAGKLTRGTMKPVA